MNHDHPSTGIAGVVAFAGLALALLMFIIMFVTGDLDVVSLEHVIDYVATQEALPTATPGP